MKFSLLLFPSLFVIFWIFLKIGLVFLGGGYVILPVIHTELVTNLHLLTEQEFIDGMAISQLTPGPVAIIATFAGYIIANIWGALLCTFAMFLPGSALMFFISKNYNKIKNSTFASKILSKIIPVVVGLLIAVSLQLGQAVLKDINGLIATVIALILLIRFKTNPIILILIFAITGFIFHKLF